MKTKSLTSPARRFVLILSALAAAAGLSSCTTGFVEYGPMGAGAGYDHGHGSAWGSWEGRPDHSGHGGHGGPGGHRGHSGHSGHSGHAGHAGHGDSLPGTGSGAGDMWTGPLPWPGGVRPDGFEPGRVGGFTPRRIDPEIAGRLRPEPRGVDPSRIRPDIRLIDPGAIRAGLRPEPRPADFRLSPGTAERLRSVSPETLRASVTPTPRPSDVRLNPAAAAHLRSIAPIPAAAVRPASTSTLRVNPETLRTPGAGSGSLRLIR